MKTIALFPGTDAIEKAEIRKMAFQMKSVKAKITLTEQIILKNTGRSLDLSDYMVQENERSLQGFQKLVLCSLATQVAIFDSYKNSGYKVDVVMGLSLGDVARSVVSNLVSFENAVLLLYKFTELGATVAPGATMQIHLDQPIQEMEKVLNLEASDLEISVLQNDYFFLIAGGMEELKKWIATVAIPHQIKYKLMYPFPLHCKLMDPISKALSEDIEKACEVDQKLYPIFSTVFAKELKEQEEILTDSKLNINSTLRFTDTIKTIIDQYQKVKFVSIGPASTLLKFIEKMNLNLPNVEMEDWFLTKKISNS